MRVSIREDDKGYSKKAYDCVVYLDGKKVDDCFTADEELGEAHCFEKDSEGAYMLTPDKKSIKEIIKKGDVKIVVPFSFMR